MSTLDKTFNDINTICKNMSTEDLTEQDTLRLEKLESKYAVDIYVLQSTGSLIYPTRINLGDREFNQMTNMLKEYIYGYMNPNFERRKVLKQKDNYYIISLYDAQRDSSYIDMYALVNTTFPQLESGIGARRSPDTNIEDFKVVLLRTNFESIEEGVSIANDFLAYVGIIAVILGSLAMLIISKKFTQPILELSGIAKRMSDLDFEVKYKVKSRDEIGELGNSINTLSDKLENTIQELKQANNELVNDIRKKTEIDEMRKEFLSNVSHELKTPISLIQGYAEGLKENINEDAEGRDFYCEVIMDEAYKMNNMVKKLLSLNELEFGNNQVNFERFDVVTLIRSVLSSTEILFKQKEVTLHFDQTDPVYVWADEYLIEQVVTNYISNALNHVSGQKIIEIKLIPREDTVRIAVFNTGENIPEEDMIDMDQGSIRWTKQEQREYGRKRNWTFHSESNNELSLTNNVV
jgi:signal transduction histidine kinase